MGDHVRTLIAAEQNDIIIRENLIEGANTSGAYFKSQLEELAKVYPEMMANVRGRGLCLAYDIRDLETRTKMIAQLKLNGVNSPVCGVSTIRASPSYKLYFEQGLVFISLQLTLTFILTYISIGLRRQLSSACETTYS